MPLVDKEQKTLKEHPSSLKHQKHPQWIKNIKNTPQWIKNHHENSSVSQDHQPNPQVNLVS